MTGAELARSLADLEFQATELAVEVVRNIAAVRARLAVMEELVAIGEDRWTETRR